jgi:hypothetical protein
MASNAKLKKSDAATERARVLTDFDTYGLKNGQIFEGEKSVVAELAQLGIVDPSEDAVGHAMGLAAEIVVQPTEADAATPAAE